MDPFKVFDLVPISLRDSVVPCHLDFSEVLIPSTPSQLTYHHAISARSIGRQPSVPGQILNTLYLLFMGKWREKAVKLN